MARFSRLAAPTFAIALLGCASSPAALPPPTKALCLPMTQYSKSQDKALAAAYEALPANSPLRGFIRDYVTLRDEVRAACR